MTEAIQAPQYYIVNLSHLTREQKYVTFWRPENKGYAFPLCWAGKYSKEEVLESLDYYNSGENIAVPCGVVDALTEQPESGNVDGDAGPVVRSNRKNWKVLQANAVATPKYPYKPVYPGAAGKMLHSYQLKTKQV